MSYSAFNAAPKGLKLGKNVIFSKILLFFAGNSIVQGFYFLPIAAGEEKIGGLYFC